MQSAGVTLNKEKCTFRVRRISFLGHILDSTGVSADPEKVTAITKMKAPTGVPELRRFLGMVNQMG